MSSMDDGNRAVVSLQHHAEGVADQNGFGAGLFDKSCEGCVVGRDADELLAAAFILSSVLIVTLAMRPG
jgi:hypothetical protein